MPLRVIMRDDDTSYITNPEMNDWKAFVCIIHYTNFFKDRSTPRADLLEVWQEHLKLVKPSPGVTWITFDRCRVVRAGHGGNGS